MGSLRLNAVFCVILMAAALSNLGCQRFLAPQGTLPKADHEHYLPAGSQPEPDKAWGGVRFDEDQCATQRLEVRLEHGPFKVLNLKNINGATRIVGGFGPVKVEAIKRIRAGRKPASRREAKSLKKELESRLKTIEVGIHPDGQTLRIQTLAPTLPDEFNTSVDYVIHVPQGQMIEVETANGSVQLGNVGRTRVQVTNGNIECQFSETLEAGVTNGRVTCADVFGNITIRVANGQAELTQSRPNKWKIDIQAGQGQIKLALPEKSAFSLDAAVKTGSITSDFPVSVGGQSAARHARGTVGSGGPEVRLQVQTGSIGLHKLATLIPPPIADTVQRYDLYCGGEMNVSFAWRDIPTLLELAQDRTVLENKAGKFAYIPGTHASSYCQEQCVKGMVALYLIEGVCQYEATKAITQPNLTSFFQYLPLHTFCTNVNPKPGWWSSQNPQKDEASLKIHRTVLAAYRKWWAETRALPPLEAVRRDPLAGAGLHWHGDGRSFRRMSADANQRGRKVAPTPPRIVTP